MSDAFIRSLAMFRILFQLHSCFIAASNIKIRLIKVEYVPPLSSEHQGWNAGKGDCGHYRSQLGFSIHMGRGFIQGAQVFKGGAWTPPEAILSMTLPVTFTTNLAPHTSSMVDLAINRAGLTSVIDQGGQPDIKGGESQFQGRGGVKSPLTPPPPPPPPK